MSEAQLVRRIDRNSVVGDTKEILKMCLADETTTHFLYRVGGICIGVVKGKSQFGEWIKLVGRFKAQNLHGDLFISSKAFLPGDIAQIIAEKMLGDIDQVTFLYDVFVRYDDTLATKYGFIVEPVRKPDEADPLDALFASAKALPAPEKQKALASPGKKS